MRLHPSSPSTGEDLRELLRRIGTPVLVGSAVVAVVAGFVGLTWVNSRSSSCETANESGASTAESSATADAGSPDGEGCDTAALLAGTVPLQPATADETTSASNEPDRALSDEAMSDDNMADHDMADQAKSDQAKSDDVVVVTPEADSTDPDSVAPAPSDNAPADGAPVDSAPADGAPASSTPAPATSTPTEPAPTTPSTPANPDPAPATSAPSNPTPANPDPVAANYSDITTFGVFHGTSSHTHGDSLAGGRTAITTEALVAYNGLRAFHGLDAAQPDAIGRWAFANRLTNNSEAYGQELSGVGLYYGMQGAKVGWIRDNAFDPQILADIQRAARQGDTGAVMTMVETFGHPGYADYLTRSGLVDAFVNTLSMEPHYGGWMHGRVHGGLPFSDGTGASVATAHDLNHLTVLSHDQQQPFMNDTFDWPQWPALDVPESTVIDYFQSMVVLGDPHGESLP